MKKTITVNAQASISVMPDTVVLDMTVSGKSMEHSEASEKAMAKYSGLCDALKQAGIDEKKLKTTGFNLSPEYEYVTDSSGNGKNVFVGYECVISLRLHFDNNIEVINNALNAVNGAELNSLNISYTVRKKKKAEKKLIEKLSKKARKRAEEMCAANGAEPGKVLKISYQAPDYGFASARGIVPMADAGFSAKMSMTQINPEKIKLTRSAIFVMEMK